MKKAYEILEKIRLTILSENFKNTYRVKNKDFVRNCLISFPMLVLLILNLMRKSLQVELNDVAKLVLESDKTISKQVFSAARKKLRPSAFIELNQTFIKEFYCDNEFKTFMGYRLIVIDGSTLQLPDGDSIKNKYGTCSNQKEGMNMARISEAYDPLNGITLSAIIKPYNVCERDMAFDHIVEIIPSNCANDLLIFDRGYPSITFIYFLLYHSKNFVMRCSTGWLDIVNKVLKSGKKDVIIEIKPKMLKGKKRKEFQKLMPSIDLNSSAKIRVLIIDLCTGEKEILITSFLDIEIFKYECFKDLYHLRWGGEENYKIHKIRMEAENFSGKSSYAIEQDFHATILTGNIRALLALEAEGEERNSYVGKYKYEYKINKNVSIGVLKNEIITALFNSDINLEVFCEKIKKIIKKSVVPIRPNRKNPHSRKNNRKYHMNGRRAL